MIRDIARRVTEQVRLRAARPAERHPVVRSDEEPRPGDDSGPRKRARWFSRRPVAAALVTVLTVGVVVTVTPAEGAAGDFASSFARVVRNLVSTSHNGQAFAGTPAASFTVCSAFSVLKVASSASSFSIVARSLSRSP